MYTFTQRLRNDAAAIRGMINFEPRIRLDFSKTDLATTITVMFCLIEAGVNTPSAIFDYLSGRGSCFDRDTVDFLLNQYDGHDVDSKLWTRRNFSGSYLILSDEEEPLGSYDYISN